jgi:hypothetical protein
MAIPEEILSEFNIPSPNSQPDGDGEPVDLGDITDGGIDARLESLWGDKSQQQQPAQQTPAQQQTAPKTADGSQPAQGQQPAANAVIDPVKQFEDASSKAFFTDSGDVDSQKINDYYLTNGKSFMKYATPDTSAPVVSAPAAPEKVDPVKEYNEKVSWVAEKRQSQRKQRRCSRKLRKHGTIVSRRQSIAT